MPIQVHMPEQLGQSGILTIDGAIACSICGEPVTQLHVERQEIIALTGKRAYVAHVKHFYWINPATGDLTETAEYAENMSLFAMKYGIGEGLTAQGEG